MVEGNIGCAAMARLQPDFGASETIHLHHATYRSDRDYRWPLPGRSWRVVDRRRRPAGDRRIGSQA